MKIGIFTDLHLGLRQYGLTEREEDFYEQYDKAIRTFIKAGVEVVLCAGDIFDVAKPTPKALKSFSNGIKALSKNNIKFLNIVGNHSIIQSPDFVTPDAFLEAVIKGDSYQLIDGCITLNGVFIAGLPFHFNYKINEMKEKIGELNEKAGKSGMPSILMLHQSFKEFCGFSGEELSINDIETSNFNLIVCGHIHEKKLVEINNSTVFLQPGSLERCNVAEARDEEHQGKGIFIIDTDDLSIESISNGFIALGNDRAFLIFDAFLNDKEQLREIEEEILHGVRAFDKPPVLFMTVHDITQSFIQLMDMIKDIKKKCVTAHFNYFDESKQEVAGLISESNKDIPSPREALKLALKPFDENEARLGLDLFDMLKDGKDVSSMLEEYLDKKRKEQEESQEPFTDSELEEFETYFNGL